MRSIRGSLNQLQPLVDVSIGNADEFNADRETYLALIDTGATRTCITERVIARFSLRPVTKLLVASATSPPERRRAYEFSLGLFCTNETETIGNQSLYTLGRTFVAPVFKDNGNFDVLLGMDLLSQGRLVFEIGGDFSFRFDL